MRRFYRLAPGIASGLFAALLFPPGAAAVPGERLGVSLYCAADPVAPGGGGTLQIVVTNNDQELELSEITFELDLESILPGLVATGSAPEEEPCGPGSRLVPGGKMRLEGGRLPPGGAECNFWVGLEVPASAPWPAAIPLSGAEVVGQGPHGEVVKGPVSGDDLDTTAPWGGRLCPPATVPPCLFFPRWLGL